MQFEEFKNLITKRKELLRRAELEYEKYNQDNSSETLNEYTKLMSKCKEIEQLILKGAGVTTDTYFEGRLLKILSVKAEDFESAVVESLSKTTPCYFYQFDSVSKKVFEIKGKKIYLHYKDRVNLTCLAKDDENVGQLLKECPELEDVLWNIVKENVKTVTEEERSKLIKRMVELKQMNDFLSDPKQISDKIEENNKEKQNCQREWEELSRGDKIIF